jgi:hypothetical protein
MIQLKHLLNETINDSIVAALRQIKTKQYDLIGSGDNGTVYKIRDTNLVFKKTSDEFEYNVAAALLRDNNIYNTFIPIHYVDGNNMYIMSNATDLTPTQLVEIQKFFSDYKHVMQKSNDDVSILEWGNQQSTYEYSVELIEFISQLYTDCNLVNIDDLAVDIDFRPENVMQYNGRMVMVDW